MKKEEEFPEPRIYDHVSKLNWLRAAVLGANDGIVSVAGLVVGVAGATDSTPIILTAGMAGIIAGAISMAAGEYISVSSSRDTEIALLKEAKQTLKNFPQREFENLVAIYENKGLSKKTARTVVEELTKKDAVAAHIDATLGIDPENLTNPWHAALASAVSFLTGAIIPLITVLVFPVSVRVPLTFVSVILALIITGTVSARIGKAPVLPAVLRVVVGGSLAMLVTYGIGRLFKISSL